MVFKYFDLSEIINKPFKDQKGTNLLPEISTTLLKPT